jgi:hypothetical protein
MVLFGRNRIIYAIAHAENAEVKALLDKGVDANATDGEDRSLLYHAISNGNRDAALLLLDKGARVDAPDGGEGTLLHFAARNGSVEICQTLLEKNPALLNKKNSTGSTAMHAAAERGHEDVIRFLVSQGANPAEKNYNNRTPLYIAQQHRQEDAATLLRSLMPVAAPAPAVSATAAAPEPESGLWRKLPGERIARVTEESAIGYRITEIFNFAARERTTLYQNLETKSETAETRGFDQIGDKVALTQALAELRARGGVSDASSLNALGKPKLGG